MELKFGWLCSSDRWGCAANASALLRGGGGGGDGDEVEDEEEGGGKLLLWKEIITRTQSRSAFESPRLVNPLGSPLPSSQIAPI
jgi:hypothetical protein